MDEYREVGRKRGHAEGDADHSRSETLSGGNSCAGTGLHQASVDVDLRQQSAKVTQADIGVGKAQLHMSGTVQSRGDTARRKSSVERIRRAGGRDQSAVAIVGH